MFQQFCNYFLFWGVKVGKKEPNNVWIVLKNYFLKIWKLTMEHYIYKNMFYFFNKFLYFQSFNYKIFIKIQHVSKVIGIDFNLGTTSSFFHVFTLWSYLQLHFNYFLTILLFILPSEQHLIDFHPRKTTYGPLDANVTNLVTTLWIYKGVGYIRILKCILWIYINHHITCVSKNYYQHSMALILWLHYVYILNILKFNIIYLLNILQPYYKFIQFILSYFLKLLQMTFIIIILVLN
jgi:hypothetical protein